MKGAQALLVALSLCGTLAISARLASAEWLGAPRASASFGLTPRESGH